MEEWTYSASILAVSRRYLAAKVMVSTRTSKFEFVKGQVALGHVFLPLLRFFPLSIHYPYSHNYHRRYSMLAIYSASV
jgi:hypothetical protein